MANRSTSTDRARVTFLAALAETCNVSEAARAAGIPRRTVYGWREADEGFAADWKDIEEAAADMLEQVAYERATDGKSDRMLEILLKAHRPDKFVERSNVKVEGLEGLAGVIAAARKRVAS